MRSTAKSDLAGYAQRIIDRSYRFNEEAKKALADLAADAESMNDAAIAERKQEIFGKYKSDMANLRSEYGGKFDLRTGELRKLGKHIAPPAMNPSAVSVLQLLQMSPVITQPMLLRAAEQIGDDLQAQEILQQIADNAGYGDSIRGTMKQPERHLTTADLDGIADDITASFCRYFDTRRNHPDDDSVIWNSPAEKFVVDAERNQTFAELSDIAAGKNFNFGGNYAVAAEYDRLETNTEL